MNLFFRLLDAVAHRSDTQPEFGRLLSGREEWVVWIAREHGYGPLYKSSDGRVTILVRGRIPVTFPNRDGAESAMIHHTNSEFDAALEATVAFEDDAKEQGKEFIRDEERRSRRNSRWFMAGIVGFFSIASGLSGRYGRDGDWTQGIQAALASASGWLVLFGLFALFENFETAKCVTSVRDKANAICRNTFLREFGCSALVASVVTPTLRYLLGWHRLFSGYDWLFAFLTSLLVLDLTNRLGGKRGGTRDYVLALAAAFILLALFHPRPHPIRFP